MPVYFDVETDGLPPCDITIACTLHKDEAREWVSRDPDGKAVLMTPETALALLDYIETHSDGGRELVTFNGAKFDLQLLYNLVDTPEAKETVARLTRAHVDLMLSCALRLGYYTSMDSLAKGSLDRAMCKTATGAQAVKWWKSAEIQELVDYCAADCRVLAGLHTRATEKKMLYRMPRNGGTRKAVDTAEALLPVNTIVAMPPHKEEWMRPNAEILTSSVSWLPPLAKRAKK